MSNTYQSRVLSFEITTQNDPDIPKVFKTWKVMKRSADDIIRHWAAMGNVKPQLHMLAIKAPNNKLLCDFEDYLMVAAKTHFRYFLINRVKYANHSDSHANLICFGCWKHSQVLDLADVMAQSFGEDSIQDKLRARLEATLKEAVPNLDPEAVEDPK